MSSVITLSFVLGAGVGAGIMLVIWLTLRHRRPAWRDKHYDVPESTVYFGSDVPASQREGMQARRDDYDHPDDIERATSIESYRPRDYEERYSGMGLAKGGRPA